MEKIVVLTSGGDSPGMNAGIRAVVRTSVKMGFETFGSYRGFQGLVFGEMREMDELSISGIIQQGGSILTSSRCDEFTTEEGRRRVRKSGWGRTIQG